jgi:tetratricopeptide (TPR) repeat protein
LLLVTLLCSAAHADKRGGKDAQARDLYKRGMTHYELGDYDTAIDEFKAAYELTHAPGLLFNLAQVQRMKKDYDQALHSYKMYLRLEPNAPNKSDVEALITDCQKAFDEAEKAKQAPPPLVPPPVVTPSPPPVLPPVVLTPPPPPPPRHWKVKVWAGGAAMVAGVGLLGGAIAMHLQANDDANALLRDSMIGTNAWDGARQAVYADGQTATNAAIALDVVGVALVATGVVLTVLGVRDRALVKRLSFAPSLRGAGVACAF